MESGEYGGIAIVLRDSYNTGAPDQPLYQVENRRLVELDVARNRVTPDTQVSRDIQRFGQ